MKELDNSLIALEKAKQGIKMIHEECSRCGRVKDKLTLSERIYRCECGSVMDRDVNAAINIRMEAMRLKAS